MTSPGQLAQRLHDKWCEHMREKGFHGFLEKCPSSPECNLPYYRCEKYRVGICDYALIGTIWQQEYLATAKAALPEIEKEFGKAIAEARLDEHKRYCVSCTRGYGDDGWSRRCSERVSLEETLHDRRLEELGK